MQLSNVIRARRLELSMTQQELADTTGTSQQTITQIERYGVEPKFMLGCSLLIALDLNPVEIYNKVSV